jgi:hypothetical protein
MPSRFQLLPLLGLVLPLADGYHIAAHLPRGSQWTAPVAHASPRVCGTISCMERTPGPRTALAPAPDDLADEVMLTIVLQEMPDDDVNKLVWKYLGYTYDEAAGAWDSSKVFPKWAAKYPQPPDLVGVTRTYTREVDEPVLRAVQALQKSVPTEHKDNLRAFLAPLGWKGYKMNAPAHPKTDTGLTPNMTRRAQCAQWLYYYREALHGVSIEELRRRRDERAAEEAKALEEGGTIAPTGTTKQSVL